MRDIQILADNLLEKHAPRVGAARGDFAANTHLQAWIEKNQLQKENQARVGMELTRVSDSEMDLYSYWKDLGSRNTISDDEAKIVAMHSAKETIRTSDIVKRFSDDRNNPQSDPNPTLARWQEIRDKQVEILKKKV
jgi:hypothetical protein